MSGAELSADIAIAGGGVAGLTAAALFGTLGFSVLCMDPAAPVTDAAKPGADLRTTAFLQPAIALLAKAGLWDRLLPQAAPLQVMRIVELGPDGAPALSRDFRAEDISDAPFGWNLPNWLLRREMLARLKALPQVRFMPGVALSGLIPRAEAAHFTLSNGARGVARLLIGADGRDSFIRKALGISVHRQDYGQMALTFAVTHARPHQGVSTEVHRDGGPFTLVPLPDHEGQPASAVVWMVPGAEAARLMALPEAAFAAEATTRAGGLWGKLTLITRRDLWPMMAQRAARLIGPHCALMAEAAHVVPPIGAQGLNMSLADLACLAELAEAAPAQLGTPAMLKAYARRRAPEVALRVAGIDLLNRASIAGAAPWQKLRAGGLALLADVPWLRQAAMRAGLGAQPRR
jgi:2-octaprenyl-6-methoxyphenol hydroxylase